jgi:hypothetical protein
MFLNSTAIIQCQFSMVAGDLGKSLKSIAVSPFLISTEVERRWNGKP